MPPPGLTEHSAPLPFAPKLTMRAFVVHREAGDLVVYGSPGMNTDAAGVYVNHWHEAEFGEDLPGVPLHVHAADAAETMKSRAVAHTFDQRHTVGGDFEVIPTPGHTPGATAFLWDSGEHRILFTGDTIFLKDGEWVAAVLDSSDRASYVASLELIRELEFDVLAPWIASKGQPAVAHTSSDDARRRLDALIRRVGAG